MRLGQWAAFVAAVLGIIGATTFFAYRIRQRSALATPTPSTSTPSASAQPVALPPAIRELVNGLQLPESSEAVAYQDQLNLVITRGGIYVDGQRLANVAEVSADGRLQRVDAVFTNLKARRDEWKSKNPSGTFPGQLALWIDLSVNLTIVKSVFQTAAFAGYRNEGFVARCRCPAGFTVLPASARIPSALSPGPEPVAALALELRSDDQVELSWTSDSAAEKPSVVALSQLQPALAQRWAQGSSWPGAATPSLRALLYVELTQSFASMMKVLEALSVTQATSPAGERLAFPAFSSEFRIGAPPAGPDAEAKRIRFGATTVSGRLAPALIQAEVRRHFDDFRACYEAKLAKDPKATGRVSVRFVIDRAGEVSAADIGNASAAQAELAKPDNAGSNEPPAPTLHDKQLERCLLKAFKKMRFPPPEGGIVNVAYPIMFAPP